MARGAGIPGGVARVDFHLSRDAQRRAHLRSGGAFDPQREWASVVFLLLPLGVAALFLRSFVAHRRRHPRYDPSIAAALRTAIDHNRVSRVRLRVSMVVTTLAMALLPVVTHQLQLVGKQRPRRLLEGYTNVGESRDAMRGTNQ